MFKKTEEYKETYCLVVRNQLRASAICKIINEKHKKSINYGVENN